MQFVRISISVCAISLTISAAAAPTLQTLTIRLTPQNAIGGGCPMNSAIGGLPTTRYSTAAAEGNVLRFMDPLPAGAALVNIEVRPSMLGMCPASNALQFSLNPALPGVDPAFSQIPPALQPAAHVTSCSTPVQFRRNLIATSRSAGRCRPALRARTGERAARHGSRGWGLR